MPIYWIIRSDGQTEYADADWYRHDPDSGWTFERVGLAPREPRHVVVRRLREDRVVLVTDLDRPV